MSIGIGLLILPGFHSARRNGTEHPTPKRERKNDLDLAFQSELERVAPRLARPPGSSRRARGKTPLVNPLAGRQESRPKMPTPEESHVLIGKSLGQPNSLARSGVSQNGPSFLLFACCYQQVARIAAGGMTLRRFLKDSAPWRFTKAAKNTSLLAVFEKVGSWLRIFQKIDRPEKTVSLSATRSYLDMRLELLIQNYRGAFNSAGRAAVLRHFDRLSREAGTAQFAEVGVHADFCPDNVLVVNDNEIAVLDFEMVSAGTMYEDLSHMYMHMDTQRAKPWIRAEGIHELQRAMLRGFDPTLEAAHPMFQVALLTNVVCHFAFRANAGKTASRIQAIRDNFLWRNREFSASLRSRQFGS